LNGENRHRDIGRQQRAEHHEEDDFLSFEVAYHYAPEYLTVSSNTIGSPCVPGVDIRTLVSSTFEKASDRSRAERKSRLPSSVMAPTVSLTVACPFSSFGSIFRTRTPPGNTFSSPRNMRVQFRLCASMMEFIKAPRSWSLAFSGWEKKRSKSSLCLIKESISVLKFSFWRRYAASAL